MLRTHGAGTLRKSDVGTTVALAGWVSRRRDHGGVAFIDLRDASGSVQVVIRDEKIAGALRAEWCIKIVGEVLERPSGNENASLATGDVEVMGDEITILSESAPLPFPIDSGDDTEINEEVRLHYRYLDLRREKPAKNLRHRSKVTSVIRNVMDEQEFLDIETPYLTRATPEGARDFLVPVRLQPGSWYALPQSPQLFKQLLMVGGLERYYQIVRCFRDEDSRADRLPEFTQLDIEMAFVDEDDVLELLEAVFGAVFASEGFEVPAAPWERVTWADAMSCWGSDRPDRRFGLELHNLSEAVRGTEFQVFRGALERQDSTAPAGAVLGINAGTRELPRYDLDALTEFAKGYGAKGLVWAFVQEDGSLRSPIAKFLSEAE